MFHSNRWAEAFVRVSGENAVAVFACFKALIPPLKSMRGVVLNRGAAPWIEKLLRESAGTAKDPAVECSIRFITLLVEKNCFRHIDSVLQKIEQRMDEQMGILDVIAESAVPMNSGFEEEIRRLIMERTGATGVKMKTKVTPDLLGGYRLRIGGFCVDASLKGQLEQMKEDLIAAVRTTMAAMHGGGNGEL